MERIETVTMDEEAAADAFIAVRLTPTDEKMKEHVTEVRVLINRALACAAQVEVTDQDGDRTVIRFKNLKINTGLDADDLDLEVPAGTSVSRPLEGVAEPTAADGGDR